MPIEVRTSQSTNSLSPRSNESNNDESDLPCEDSRKFVNHHEEDDDIFDVDKSPEEKAAADLRANRRRGYDPNSSLDENNASFLSGVETFVSSTPSLKRAIKKKKVQSDSDSDERSSTQQVVYRKGQPTATLILIYEDSRREVVQQCIANLMSTFHLYPHSEGISNSFTERFDDLLRWLYKTDKTNRDTCKNWRAWSREKFVKHLRLLYPQLSNAADKSYLEMIREIPFQYNLDNPVVKLKFQSEEAEAVKILLGKINIPSVFNWIPIFNEMATGCDVPIPVTTLDDFRFLLMAYFEDARRSRARTISYRCAVIGTPETHHGDIKAVSFKEKNQANPTKSGNKTPTVSKADVVICQFCGKNNHSNANYLTRTSEFTNNQNRPYIGSEAHGRLIKPAGDRDWIPNFKELKGLMSKAGQSSGPSSSAVKPSKPSKDWKSKGTYASTIFPIKLHIATSPNLLPVVLTFVSQEEAKGSINVDALLDTGCLPGDFVARRVVDEYNIKPVIHSAAKLSVCSGLHNTCHDMSKSVIISVNYFNERLNNINAFEIKAIILDTSPLDFIIGRATIKKLGLVHQVPSQFLNIGKVLITECSARD